MISIKFDEEKFNSVLSVMPETFTLYKLVYPQYSEIQRVGFGKENYRFVTGREPNKNYRAFYRNCAYQAGLNISESGIGFHSFVKIKDVMANLNEFSLWQNARLHYYMSYLAGVRFNPMLIQCICKKQWVTVLGHEDNGSLVVVSKRLIIPEYPRTSLTKQEQQYYLSTTYLDEGPSMKPKKQQAANLEPLETNEVFMGAV